MGKKNSGINTVNGDGKICFYQSEMKIHSSRIVFFHYFPLSLATFASCDTFKRYGSCYVDVRVTTCVHKCDRFVRCASDDNNNNRAAST